ncbi:hypothetical protein T01_5146 [Trichinella spiralis]|uniref:Uncharacterized protein n=1 Tax=Trichinella spiralis TaxID=6334 RepID=A0A0V1BAS8_TRISP|nr:hypothetical protein T01_5146 [Trichinella spiralis]
MDPMQMSESVDESEKKEDIVTFQRFPNENIANIPRGGRETETTPVVKFYKSSFGSASEKQKCTQIKRGEAWCQDGQLQQKSPTTRACNGQVDDRLCTQCAMLFKISAPQANLIDNTFSAFPARFIQISHCH